MLDNKLRQAVLIIAAANLAYFGVEFAVALKIGSASLLADSADFVEDASVNLYQRSMIRTHWPIFGDRWT